MTDTGRVSSPGHAFTCAVCGKPGVCIDGSDCLVHDDGAHCHNNECMEAFDER